MADNSLQRMLEINSRFDSGEKLNTYDSISQTFNENMYGDQLIPMDAQREEYHAEDEMERIKGHMKPVDLEKKKIPSYIVEEILKNPIDVSSMANELEKGDSRWAQLEEKIKGKKGGINASAELLKKIETQESKQKIIENKKQNINEIKSSNIDYSIIKSIVESVLDEKLKSLNESINIRENAPSAKILSFKDKFYFVDNKDNVFECVMEYKGKRKRKKN